MHYYMPPSKTGWPNLYIVIFPPAMHLAQDDPKTLTTPEIIEQIHELILEEHRISAKSIAAQLGFSRERVGSIIRKDLDKRKISAKWIPKFVKADRTRQRCHLSEQHLEFIRRDPNDFMSRLVIMDETWLYIYDPEKKQKISGVGAQRLTPPPRVPSAKIRCKISRLDFFWDQDGILLIDYLPKGQTINAEYYSSLLVQLKDF